MELKEFEERYEIFQDGTIISLITNKPICQWKDNVGYLQVKLKKNGKNYYKRVHRLVAEHFIPNPNGLPQVNHIDGDKTNNNKAEMKPICNPESASTWLAPATEYVSITCSLSSSLQPTVSAESIASSSPWKPIFRYPATILSRQSEAC